MVHNLGARHLQLLKHQPSLHVGWYLYSSFPMILKHSSVITSRCPLRYRKPEWSLLLVLWMPTPASLHCLLPDSFQVLEVIDPLILLQDQHFRFYKWVSLEIMPPGSTCVSANERLRCFAWVIDHWILAILIFLTHFSVDGHLHWVCIRALPYTPHIHFKPVLNFKGLLRC